VQQCNAKGYIWKGRCIYLNELHGLEGHSNFGVPARSNTFTKNSGEERTFQIPELSMPHQSNYTGAGVVKSQVG
jgi:hypothetical protein